MALEQDPTEKWYNWTLNGISKRTYGSHKENQRTEKKHRRIIEERMKNNSLSGSKATWNW